MQKVIIIVSCLVSILLTNLVFAGTIYVKEGETGTGTSWAEAYGDFQTAVANAGIADEVWVAMGTYYPDYAGAEYPRETSFQMKNWVGIYGGFANTGDPGWGDRDPIVYETILSGDIGTIDDPNDNCYHVFNHPEGTNLNPTAILDGFTITSGNADINAEFRIGGGMYNNGSSPSVINCTFANNMANDDGGGMNNKNCSPIITGCSFIGNQADDAGGGMYNWFSSSPALTDCTFIGNSAGGNGGGMYSNGGSVTVTNCTMTNNAATLNGGGMYNDNSNPIVTDSAFITNSAGDNGGGIYTLGTVTMTTCTFRGNSAYSGGGIFNAFSSPSVTTCTFIGNSGVQGGAMCNFFSSPTVASCVFNSNVADYGGVMFNVNNGNASVTGCTMIDNSAINDGGGMYNHSSSPTVSNTILRGNTASSGNEIALTNVSTINVDHSDVQGGSGGIHEDGSGNTINWGVGNIDENPLFVDADGQDDTPGNEDDDLRLQANSPCIDAGDNTAVVAAWDMNANTRIMDGDGIGDATVDMGAYEYGLSVIYVDSGAAGGNNNGASWGDAFTSLQSALDIAIPGDEIWVAAGTYNPTSDHGLSIGDRGRHFRMKNSVAIYGGFSGVENVRAQRNVQNNQTILSGDIGTLDDETDNCYHVFYHPDGLGLDPNAILDGFIITKANGEGSDPHGFGGGMYNHGNSPTVTGCAFIGNLAERGGGMYNHFSSNQIITGCRFIGNSASNGGGMYTVRSSANLDRCSFIGNRADFGGGINSTIESTLTVNNCTFSGNSAYKSYGKGGGIYNSSSSLSIINSSLTGNFAGDEGGGVFVHSSNPVISNCILWNNTAALGNEIALISSAIIDVDHSDVQGGSTGIYDDGSGNTINWGVGNIDIEPLFVDADGIDDTSGTGDDNLRVSAVSQCIDSGDNSVVTGVLDLDERERITDGNNDGTSTVDMGAYEYPVFVGYEKVVYVDTNATSTNNSGTSWKDAFLDLQDALDASTGDPNQIWVAEGTYYPSQLTDPADPRTACFQMINFVAIYGGFEGTETSLSQRNVQTNETILSGNIGLPDDPNDNCYHIFYHPNGWVLDPNGILDGFTITAADANGIDDQARGAGMFNHTSSPTVNNCKFTANSSRYGGVMYNRYYSSPIVTDCTFIDSEGNGMRNYLYSSPMVINCTFRNNVGDSPGGGMSNSTYSSPTIINCTFSGNSGLVYGGGMYNGTHSSPEVINTVFSGNSVDNLLDTDGTVLFYGEGGGIYNENSSSPIITNCTFTANSAEYGGAISISSGTTTVTNCILWDNTATFGNEISLKNAPTIIISYSDVQGGQAGIDKSYSSIVSWGSGNIDSDPFFVDAVGPDAVAGTQDDNLRLEPISPCIDVADSNAVNVATDLDANPRIADGNCDEIVTVDMGGYESASGWLYFGDFDGSCDVELADFRILSKAWQTDDTPTPGWNPVYDLDASGVIDIGELKIMTANWLMGI